MTDWVIRQAHRSDEEDLRRVCLATYEDDYVLSMMDAFFLTGTVFMAFADEEPVGAVKVEVATDGSGWVSALRTVPAWRRRGVGASLCRRCEEAALEGGSEAIRLWTGGGNAAANALFQSLGYREVGAFTRWWGEVDAEEGQMPRTVADWRDAKVRILESRVFQASNGYVPLAMRFCRLDDGVMTELGNSGRLFVDVSGAPSILDTDVWMAFDRKVVELTVVGDDVSAQVATAARLGAESGLDHIGTFLPRGEPWSDWAARAGLKKGTWGTNAILYEKRIGQSDGTVIKPWILGQQRA